MMSIAKPHLSIKHSDELYHHGILGQKWGIRRFQNPDGSLTPAGKQRYNIESLGSRKAKKQYDKYSKEEAKRILSGEETQDDRDSEKAWDKFDETLRKNEQKLLWNKTIQEFNSKVEDIVDEYVNTIAKKDLRNMGYSDNEKSVEWLKRQPWYRETVEAYNMAYDIVSPIIPAPTNSYRS